MQNVTRSLRRDSLQNYYYYYVAQAATNTANTSYSLWWWDCPRQRSPRLEFYSSSTTTTSAGMYTLQFPVLKQNVFLVFPPPVNWQYNLSSAHTFRGLSFATENEPYKWRHLDVGNRNVRESEFDLNPETMHAFDFPRSAKGVTLGRSRKRGKGELSEFGAIHHEFTYSFVTLYTWRGARDGCYVHRSECGDCTERMMLWALECNVSHIYLGCIHGVESTGEKKEVI